MSCDIQPARQNHQPTGHQTSRQGLYVPKKAYFGARMAVLILYHFGREQKIWYPHINHLGTSFAFLFLVKHGTKWIRKSNMWPTMAKNANFGSNLAVFGQILIFTVGGTSFCTHIMENHPGTLFALFFWSGMGPKGPKMQIFGP